MSGHACMQRVICETAETPFHMDGLMGEVSGNVVIVAAANSIKSVIGERIQIYVREHRFMVES